MKILHVSYIEEAGLFPRPFVALPDPQIPVMNWHRVTAEWDHLPPIGYMQIVKSSSLEGIARIGVLGCISLLVRPVPTRRNEHSTSITVGSWPSIRASGSKATSIDDRTWCLSGPGGVEGGCSTSFNSSGIATAANVCLYRVTGCPWLHNCHGANFRSLRIVYWLMISSRRED